MASFSLVKSIFTSGKNNNFLRHFCSLRSGADCSSLNIFLILSLPIQFWFLYNEDVCCNNILWAELYIIYFSWFWSNSILCFKCVGRTFNISGCSTFTGSKLNVGNHYNLLTARYIHCSKRSRDSVVLNNMWQGSPILQPSRVGSVR